MEFAFNLVGMSGRDYSSLFSRSQWDVSHMRECEC